MNRFISNRGLQLLTIFLTILALGVLWTYLGVRGTEIHADLARTI
jgi:hypothetical protein